jgi:hypothetical protein
MHEVEKDNVAKKKERDEALSDRHAVADRALVEERRQSDQKYVDEEARMKAKIDAEKLAAEQRVDGEKRQVDAKYAARESALVDAYEEIRDAAELEIVTNGLRQILIHANGYFAKQGGLPIQKIEDFLKTEHEAAAKKRVAVTDKIEADTSLDTPAQRSAHERTLAAWRTLHITQGFYMEKAVHRAPLVPLAHRRI